MFDNRHDFRLPVSSQAEALDWSLLLASQGIPHFIAPPDESGAWGLVLAAADARRARTALALYKAENAPRPWQQPVLAGRVLFDWAAALWALPLAVIHALAARQPELLEVGVMHGMAVSQGEWWRLVTATQLHTDGGHLAGNLTIGFLLAGLALGRWGTAVGFAAILLTGVGGNLLNWLVQPEVRSLGASGAVMGCLGLLAVPPRSDGPRGRRAWRGLAVGLGAAVMLFTLLGLDPRADVVAHGGGFAAGVVLAVLLRWRPARRERWWEWLAAAGFAALLVGAWAAAVREAR